MDVTLWQLLRYDDWANREVLRALQSAPRERSCTLLAHVVGAEWLWLGRLRQDPQPSAVWPAWSLEECAARLQPLLEDWRGFLETTPDLDATIRYENSKGEIWESGVRHVVTHVVLHSAYHRGQIAQDARASGTAPAYTDFIHCMRQGFVD